MQYREIYQVLEDRRKADPHFVYDDYSRCRPKSQRHGRILGPLWNVAIARFYTNNFYIYHMPPSQINLFNRNY